MNSTIAKLADEFEKMEKTIASQKKMIETLKWYEWYKRENTPYGKCKQNGERDWRWERSPYSGNTYTFCSVGNNGDAGNNYASYSIGVSFGFCI